jgi:hypothetical protein
MQTLRTVTVMGGDREPGERMPPLSKLLTPPALPELVIEKNVPVPVNIPGIRSRARIAIESLEPGDSVLIPPQISPITSVRMMLQAVRKEKPGRAFTSKSERGGLRVWRIE